MEELQATALATRPPEQLTLREVGMLLHLLCAKGCTIGLNAAVASTPGGADALQAHVTQGSVEGLCTAFTTFSRGDVAVPGRWGHMDAGNVRLSDVVELQEELRRLLQVC